jgi:Zn-finger nucleic acid-binding protein
MPERTVAVFIDADNISPASADDIFTRARTLGEPIIRRAYGTVNCFSAEGGWAHAQREYGILARPQVSNVSGKNVADIALVIDAMEALYRSPCDGICIVSSDSDFTALAAKVREGGKEVYGMGGDKTPESFLAACQKFFVLPPRRKPGAQKARKAAVCPRCGGELSVSRTRSNKTCAVCQSCGGMAAKVSVLKGVFSDDCLAAIVRNAGQYERNGCICPDCGGTMSIVKVSAGTKYVEIDVCAKCRTVWYDRDEFESLVPNDGPLQATVSAGKAYRRGLVASLSADLRGARLKVPDVGALKCVLKKVYHAPTPDIQPVISSLMSQRAIKVEAKTGRITVLK